MSKKLLKWLPAVAVLFAAPLAAQSVPTPEGTSISNTATVNYTDANGNSYSASGTIAVTVAFKAAVDVTGTASYSPSGVSTGNQAVFTIANIGNGPDSVTVSETHTVAAITGYKIGASPTVYATLAALNAQLAATPIAYAGSLTLTVIYDMNSGAGIAKTIDITAASRRQPAATDTYSSSFTPAVAGGVVVSSPGAIDRLPSPVSAPTPYTATFNVKNNANVTRTYDLAATLGTATNGAAVTIVSVNGVAGTSATTSALAASGSAGDNQDIVVEYLVPNGANDVSVQDLVLTASYTGAGASSAQGTLTVTSVKPILVLAKTLYRSNQTTLIDVLNANPAISQVTPGEHVWYKIQITNIGHAAAQSLTMSDPLSNQLSYDGNSTTLDAAWTVTAPGTSFGGTVTASRTGTLAPNATTAFFIGVQIR